MVWCVWCAVLTDKLFVMQHIMSKARDATTGGKYLSPRLDSVDKLARQFELSVEQKRALGGI